MCQSYRPFQTSSFNDLNKEQAEFQVVKIRRLLMYNPYPLFLLSFILFSCFIGIFYFLLF